MQTAVRILAVDDDLDIRDLLRIALGDEGYRVITAANGREALALVEEEPPDLVLLDLTMPVMNGRQFLQQLRGRGCQVPVICMTAGYSAAVEASENRADAHLHKPFDLDDLFAMVERLTAAPAPA